MKLIEKIKELRKDKSLRKRIEERLEEFRELGRKESKEIFKELCFCILTANFNAQRSIKIQELIGDGFLSLPERELSMRLKKLGHRYPEARASYIVNARRYKDSIKEILLSKGRDGKREWLVENIKGIGYKEASHFLRNIGMLDYAIIDFHIIDLLEKEGLIERPKSLTKKRYLLIESILREIADQLSISLGELDLYLWYIETGKGAEIDIFLDSSFLQAYFL